MFRHRGENEDSPGCIDGLKEGDKSTYASLLPKTWAQGTKICAFILASFSSMLPTMYYVSLVHGKIHVKYSKCWHWLYFSLLLKCLLRYEILKSDVSELSDNRDFEYRTILQKIGQFHNLSHKKLPYLKVIIPNSLEVNRFMANHFWTLVSVYQSLFVDY